MIEQLVGGKGARSMKGRGPARVVMWKEGAK